MLTTPFLPATAFYLMTGSHADARLRGWVRTAQGDPTPEASWEVYGDSLTDEAARHGFRPFWLTKTRPSGDGFEAWEVDFIKLYRY